MQPRELLGSSTTPDGQPITLAREAGALVVRVAGASLMSSRVHGSEDAMAERACAPLRDRRGARVLIGGLGMGFTLRAALDALGPDAEVIVAELLPIVAEWNRDGPLAELAGRPLDDPRATLVLGDVAGVIRAAAPRSLDAVLLDVDNGPDALTTAANARLYTISFLAELRTRLRAGGAVIVWSAGESRAFATAMRRAGLTVEVERVRARGKVAKGSRHVLFVGRAPA